MGRGVEGGVEGGLEGGGGGGALSRTSLFPARHKIAALLNFFLVKRGEIPFRALFSDRYSRVSELVLEREKTFT